MALWTFLLEANRCCYDLYCSLSKTKCWCYSSVGVVRETGIVVHHWLCRLLALESDCEEFVILESVRRELSWWLLFLAEHLLNTVCYRMLDLVLSWNQDSSKMYSDFFDKTVPSSCPLLSRLDASSLGYRDRCCFNLFQLVTGNFSLLGFPRSEAFESWRSAELEIPLYQRRSVWWFQHLFWSWQASSCQ